MPNFCHNAPVLLMRSDVPVPATVATVFHWPAARWRGIRLRGQGEGRVDEVDEVQMADNFKSNLD